MIGIRAVVVESRDIPARVRGQRRPGEPVVPVDDRASSRPPHHQPILAEHLLREEGGAAEPQGTVELAASRARRLRPVQIQADRGEQRPRDRAVVVHGLQVRRPAVQEERAAAVGELVALGVAPEVVVVVENEDARAGAGRSQEEPGGGESAQPPADHHQVIALAGVGGVGPGDPVPELVGHLEGARMAPAHPRACGRIVLLRSAEGRAVEGRQPSRRDEGARDGNPDAVDEVAAGDVPVHAEIAIVTRGHGPSGFRVVRHGGGITHT